MNRSVFRMLPLSVIAAILLVGLTAPGCEQQAKPLPQAQSLTKADNVAGAAVASVADQISDDEARVFGQEWATALSEGDLAKVKQLMDWQGIFNRALDGLVDDEKFRSGFRQGADGAVAPIVSQISQATQASGAYEMVDVVRRGGIAHVVFRLFTDEGGLNYHDIKLRRDGGRLVGDEFFIAVTGEAFSDSLRNMVAPSVTSQTSLVGRMSGEAKAELDRLEAQRKLGQAMRAGNNAEALRLYDALPADVKKLKIPMLNRIMATSVDDDEAYDAAIQAYLAEFPQDASVGLVSLDAAVMRKDVEMLEQALNSLTGWTGGDPLLDLMVAANFVLLDATDKAVALAESVDMGKITNEHGHDFRLTVAMAVDDHQTTLDQLVVLRDRYGYEFQDLRQAEGFEEFTRSKEFETWQGKQ